MRIVVIADSHFGNTARVAEAIARGVRLEGAEADVLTAADAAIDHILAGRPDVVALGGPTVNRRMTAALERCVNELQPHARDLGTAAFDTRYRGADLLMGSAAKRAARILGAAGARLIAPPESFIVARAEAPRGQRTQPGLSTLADGEEARAEAWGRSLVERQG